MGVMCIRVGHGIVRLESRELMVNVYDLRVQRHGGVIANGIQRPLYNGRMGGHKWIVALVNIERAVIQQRVGTHGCAR